MALFIYDTQANAEADCKKIHDNALEKHSANWGGKLYTDPANSDSMKKYSEMTPTEKENTPILGTRKGVLNMKTGHTLRWATPQQSDDDPTKYWAPLPTDPDLLVGLTANTEEWDPLWEQE